MCQVIRSAGLFADGMAGQVGFSDERAQAPPAVPQSRSLDWRLRREAGRRAVDPDLAQLPCVVRHNEQHDSLLPRPRVHCMSSFLSTTSLSLSLSLFLSLCLLSQRGTARQHGLNGSTRPFAEARLALLHIGKNQGSLTL